MAFRILGLLMTLLPMLYGTMSIHAGVESSTVGPILGGVFIFFLSCIVFFLIVYDIAYRLVTVLTDEPETLESVYEPFQDDFTAPEDAKRRRGSGATHRELNTPDPHLIHPDDANGQRRPAPAVYGSRYAKQQADSARLNIKV